MSVFVQFGGVWDGRPTDESVGVIFGSGAHSIFDFLQETATQRFMMCLCEVGREDIAWLTSSNRVGNPNIGCLAIAFRHDDTAIRDIATAAHLVHSPRRPDVWKFKSADEFFHHLMDGLRDGSLRRYHRKCSCRGQ